MTEIKFGTDGWRAIIAQDYTIDNLMRVSEASAQWMLQRDYKTVVIGHDCRFAGKLFNETAARIFASHGIKALVSEGEVSTPMVSLGVVKCNAQLGVVITASHNPASYSGFKLKSRFGGPSVPAEIAEVEALIPQQVPQDPSSFKSYMDEGLIEYVDLEGIYLEQVEANFDLKLIRSSGIKVAYDAMYGAGQDAMKKILPDAIMLHCEKNPSFNGTPPEPIHRNLLELSELIKNDASITLGIANDGDADRIGMYNEEGVFFDSHRILLLLLHYLAKYKGQKGKIAVSFSVTNKLNQLAAHYGMPMEVTKIGFKYIAQIMLEEEVIVGGEESGGIAISGHIPERDGIWIGLTLLEFMARTGKTLNELNDEVAEIVGPFHFERNDMHISPSLKDAVVAKCKNDEFKSFGTYVPQRVETIDGYKYFFDDNTWVMIRPSGTEPVLRVYVQAPNEELVWKILEVVKGELMSLA